MANFAGREGHLNYDNFLEFVGASCCACIIDKAAGVSHLVTNNIVSSLSVVSVKRGNYKNLNVLGNMNLEN